MIGVVHIGSVKATEFSDEDKLLFRTMASRATSVVVKAQLLADLRRSETAQRFLSEASKQLAESLDYDSTLAKIAHLAVPTIADWCVVDLFQDGTVRRVAVAHTDRTKEKLVYELAERYPLEVNAPTGTSAVAGIPNVLRTGRSVLVSKVTDAELTAFAGGSACVDIIRELGLRAYVVDHTRHGRVEPSVF